MLLSSFTTKSCVGGAEVGLTITKESAMSTPSLEAEAGMVLLHNIVTMYCAAESDSAHTRSPTLYESLYWCVVELETNLRED